MPLSKFVKQKHTADKAASVTGAVMIYAVQVHANGGDADIELCDALTDTSSDELSYSALNGDTLFFDYEPLGGVAFVTGLTVDVTGTGASVIIWTDKLQATA
ncbi:unnamed protein product [marine sediment metagenome]|uniref:Uncharacterized protein n=1 Tax=marine sediment metagenome TaxID=412755 RepID=X0Z7Z1_9ZZZZ